MATSNTSCVLTRCRLFLNNFRFKDTCRLSKSHNLSICRSYSFESTPNVTNTRRSTLLLGLAGCSVGALLGAGYSYYNLQPAKQIPIINQSSGTDTERMLLKVFPDVKPSRQVVVPTDNTGLKLVLFQYATCPFCCKVRTFLDYYGFSYDVVEVNPVLRHQVKWTEYKKVPILLAQVEEGYQQLNDSSMIISALMSYLMDKQQDLSEVVKYFPSISYNDDKGKPKSEIMNRYFLMFQGEDIPAGRSKEDILQERKWRKWVDDVLVHVLSPNVYRSRDEALQAFHWFSEVGDWEKHFSPWERYLVIHVGAMAMWLVGKRLKKRHNLKEDVRSSLYDECNFWVKSLKKQKTRFMGGSRPDLSDLALFGVLNSIEGCVAFSDMLANSDIGQWYQHMKTAVQGRAGSAATE